ncbi:MAG: MFS transporter [Parvibaculales bacterium]
MTSKRPVYQGWIVLSACFFCAMLMIGITFYGYQVFVIPVTQEFGVSRATVSYAYIAMLLGVAGWSPFVGRAIDRHPPQYVFAFGALAFATGFTLLSLSQDLTHMFVIIILLVGLGVSSAGGLVANAVVSKWFMKRRGRALGIASVTSSAGGFVMVPVVIWLIESFGWRLALPILGWGAALSIVLVSLLFIRARPKPQHLAGFDEFDQDAEATKTEAAASETGAWTLPKLARERNFWLLVFGAGLLLASDQAIMTSKYPFFIDIGFSPVQAATIISSMTLSAVAGKLIIGYLADYYDVRHLFAVVAAFHVGLLVMFLWQPGFASLLGFASFFGAAVGGIYPVWSTLTAKAFGAPSFGTVFGLMAPFMQLMAIVFVRFIGEVHSLTGTYDFAFYAFLGTSLVSSLLIYAMRLPSRAG